MRWAWYWLLCPLPEKICGGAGSSLHAQAGRPLGSGSKWPPSEQSVKSVTSGSICALLACFSKVVRLNAFVPVVQAGLGEQQQGAWMTAVFYSSSYRKWSLEKKQQQWLSLFFRLWQQNCTLALLTLAGSGYCLGVSPPSSGVIVPQLAKSRPADYPTVLPQELFLPPSLCEFALSVPLYPPVAEPHYV